MRTFKFYWLIGNIEIGTGADVSDAFRKLGYGGGAITALDWYEEITSDQPEPTLDTSNPPSRGV